MLALGACGTDTSTPEGLGEAVADATSDGSIDTLKDLTCPKDRNTFAADLDPDKIREQLKAEDLEITVEFVKASAEGNQATLSFKTTFGNLPKKLTDMGMPTSSTNTQTARKQGDNWVICN